MAGALGLARDYAARPTAAGHASRGRNAHRSPAGPFWCRRGLASLRDRDGDPDFDCDLDYAPFWAGESCSVVNDIKPAGEIVSRARSRRRGGARGGQGAGVGAFALRRLSAARPAGLRTAKFH